MIQVQQSNRYRRFYSIVAIVTLVFVAIVHMAVAATQNPMLVNIPENTAMDLGAYVCKPWSLCATNTSYSGMTYDAGRHAAYVFGGGHAATYRDDVDVFSFATLTWKPAYESTPCTDLNMENLDVTQARWISTHRPVSRHTYDLLEVVGGKLWMMSIVQGRGRGCTKLTGAAPYVIAEGSFAAYDPDTHSWRFTQRPGRSFNTAAEADPISGKVLLLSFARLEVFDPTTDTVTEVLTFPAKHEARGMRGAGNGLTLVYFPPTDRFYAFTLSSLRTRGVWEIAYHRAQPASSTVRRLRVKLPARAVSSDAWDYDTANELIGGGVTGGWFFAFDPRTSVWSERRMVVTDAARVGDVEGKALIYDPIDNVFIFSAKIHSGERHTWAYRYAGAAPVPTVAPKDVEHGTDTIDAARSQRIPPTHTVR